MNNPLKNIKTGYKAILFGLTVLFVLVYTTMFVLHIGSSIINSIKYRFFTFKTVYIVSDLPANDKMLKFCVENIDRQSMQRYKYYVVDFAECKKISYCMKKVGIVISRDPEIAYSFRKSGLLPIKSKIVDFIKNGGGTVDTDIAIFHKDNTFYYYAVGNKAPFNGMLSDMPISMMSVLQTIL